MDTLEQLRRQIEEIQIPPLPTPEEQAQIMKGRGKAGTPQQRQADLDAGRKAIQDRITAYNQAVDRRGALTTQLAELEQRTQDQSWQNQARQAAPWATIPLGMGYGAYKGGKIEKRQLASEAAQRAGILPNPAQNWGPVRRSMGRMAPYAGPGLLFAGEGLGLRAIAPHIQSEAGQEIARAAGTGLVGASIGVTGKGLINSFTPQVSSNSPGVPPAPPPPRNALDAAGRAMQPGAVPLGGPSALPPPKNELDAAGRASRSAAAPAKTPYSDRLIAAARAAGASGPLTKQGAADYLAKNLSDENRSAVAKALNVKNGPNLATRIGTAIKTMASKPGASSMVGPLVAGGLAYELAGEPVEAADGSTSEPSTGNRLAAAGAGAGIAYGAQKGLNAIPKGGGAMFTGLNMPSTIDAMTDYTPEEVAQGDEFLARNLPEWARFGRVEDAYQRITPAPGNPSYPLSNQLQPETRGYWERHRRGAPLMPPSVRMESENLSLPENNPVHAPDIQGPIPGQEAVSPPKNALDAAGRVPTEFGTALQEFLAMVKEMQAEMQAQQGQGQGQGQAASMGAGMPTGGRGY